MLVLTSWRWVVVFTMVISLMVAAAEPLGVPVGLSLSCTMKMQLGMALAVLPEGIFLLRPCSAQC